MLQNGNCWSCNAEAASTKPDFISATPSNKNHTYVRFLYKRTCRCVSMCVWMCACACLCVGCSFLHLLVGCFLCCCCSGFHFTRQQSAASATASADVAASATGKLLLRCVFPHLCRVYWHFQHLLLCAAFFEWACALPILVCASLSLSLCHTYTQALVFFFRE